MEDAMSATANPILPGAVPVPLQDVERELSRQLKAPRDDKKEVVQLVRMSNLVVYCDTMEAARQVGAQVPDVVAVHPARVLLLVGDNGTSGTTIHAEVRVQGHKLGQHQQACCEQVVLSAGAFFTNGMRSEHWDAVVEGPTSQNRLRDPRPVFYFYVADGATASDYVLIKLEKKGDHREFQVGSFGGITGGKSGVKKNKEIPYKAEHVGIRMYKVTLEEDLKPCEYAFFMGTGQQASMASGRGAARSGGAASGRVYDFTIPE